MWYLIWAKNEGEEYREGVVKDIDYPGDHKIRTSLDVDFSWEVGSQKNNLSRISIVQEIEEK